MYDGHSASVRKRNEGVSGSENQPCTLAHRQDTTMLSRAGTCTRTESSPVLSASAVGRGRSDVVVPRRKEHESRRRVHDRLELLEKIRWNASQGCIAVVQS